MAGIVRKRMTLNRRRQTYMGSHVGVAICEATLAMVLLGITWIVLIRVLMGVEYWLVLRVVLAMAMFLWANRLLTIILLRVAVTSPLGYIGVFEAPTSFSPWRESGVWLRHRQYGG